MFPLLSCLYIKDKRLTQLGVTLHTYLHLLKRNSLKGLHEGGGSDKEKWLLFDTRLSVDLWGSDVEGDTGLRDGWDRWVVVIDEGLNSDEHRTKAMTERERREGAYAQT